MKKTHCFAATVVLSSLLAGCGGSEEPTTSAEVAPPDEAPKEMTMVDAPEDSSQILTRVLADQPDEAKARFASRHPEETLTFFGIEPGMTVVEALPGGGWYSKILLPYLGADGKLVGINYSAEMWPLFGFFDEEAVEGFKVWTETWPKQAEEWRTEDSASLAAYEFGKLPADAAGTADAVLLVRAMHNMRRFEDQGGYFTGAIADAFNVLKPGGVVGIVQHQAPDDWSDEWAGGGRGYLKKADVISAMEAAGFEFVAESAINENPKDVPGESDVVWRLPPTFNGTGDDPEMRAKVAAIGESNRMTLKFRKPA
ncbi:MAG: methyltransferase [Pseudomonadota bacterium]